MLFECILDALCMLIVAKYRTGSYTKELEEDGIEEKKTELVLNLELSLNQYIVTGRYTLSWR